jgi:microcystin-dependent protein
MSEPFVGEIFMSGFNFAPRDWVFCDGSLLPIAQYDVLFSLLGTIYGGDGQSTFAVPDLRGRVPIHFGQGPGLPNYLQGQLGGTEAVTLTANQIPAHSHAVSVSSTTGSSSTPNPGLTLGSNVGADMYTPEAADGVSGMTVSGGGGGSVAHANLMPYLVINFFIATVGIYPTQN